MKIFSENYFKIDYLFYTTNIGGHWCLQSYLTSYCEKKVRDMDMNLVLWRWSTRTRTRTQTKVLVLVLVLTHFFSTRTRTRTHAKQSTRTRTRTQDLCTRPNPDIVILNKKHLLFSDVKVCPLLSDNNFRYFQTSKCVRMKFNVALVCQTIVTPPPSGQEITRDHLTCRIQYTANGRYSRN